MKKSLRLLFLLPAFLMLSIFVSPAKAEAFDPGRIIDDSVFTNKNSMSVADIQNFLNSKVPVCDTWRAPGPNAQGATPPWICLKNYTENGKSAAQIIWEQAQNFNLNPQVLIVTLQKENGLITDTWPYPWQYRTAMGFACPDNGTCDPAYYGFTQQVYQAARHFRNFYDLNPAWYIPYSPGVRYVRWSPNSACGGSNVNIQNRATAALYSYTPYQPNSAALNNLYGTGDGCSAYGNRNFWRDFTNWFGSTTANDYDYQFVDANVGSTNIQEGQQFVSYIKLRNIGNKTWYSDGSTPAGVRPVRLANSGYQGMAFADTSDPAWLGTNNQIKMQEASVAPGSVATFSFKLKGTSNLVNFSQYVSFVPVVDGQYFMKDVGMGYRVNGIVSQYQVIQNPSQNISILANDTVPVTIQIKNNSYKTWYSDGNVPAGESPIRLANIGYQNTSFADLRDTSWLTANQVRMDEVSVPPGGIATFTPTIKGAFYGNQERLNFVPVMDGKYSLENKITTINLFAQPPNITYSFAGAINPPATMAPGQTVKAKIFLKNNGNVIWRSGTNNGPFSGSFRLGSINPYYSSSPFYSPTDLAWLSNSQISLKTPVVGPGGIGEFEFDIKAPSNTGNYYFGFAPVVDGYYWLANIGMGFSTNVINP